MTNKKPAWIRQKLLINREAQGAIIKRSIFHWYLYTSLILLVVVIFAALRDPSRAALPMIYELWLHYSPAILASFALLPVFILDLIKGSNRIAGPLYRLRNEMDKLKRGESVHPLKLREGDFWEELADEFNQLANQVQRERDGKLNPPSTADGSTVPSVSS